MEPVCSGCPSGHNQCRGGLIILWSLCIVVVPQDTTSWLLCNHYLMINMLWIGGFEPRIITVIVEVSRVGRSYYDPLRHMGHHQKIVICRDSVQSHHQGEVPGEGGVKPKKSEESGLGQGIGALALRHSNEFHHIHTVEPLRKDILYEGHLSIKGL